MLQQRLSQKILQKLSPQQIQLMKLLQIPTSTLDQRIQEEIEANPALDEGNDNENNEESNQTDDYDEEKPEKEQEVELDDYIQEYIEDDPMSYNLRTANNNIEDENRSIPISVESTFQEYLAIQLGLLDLKDHRLITIARQIIGSIDDDGYLRRKPLAIIDDLMFAQNINATEEEVIALLELVKEFDPPGVGAADLKECLIKQMQVKVERTEETDIPKEMALLLLTNHFDAFSKKHYTKLLKQLNINDKQLKEAIDEIIKLNPKPASGFLKSSSSRSSLYIVPDFSIINSDGELELILNSKNAPDLKINGQYVNLLQAYNDKNKDKRTSKKEKETILFVKQKINSAKWFIDAIKQRQQTLFSTMYAMMQYQKDFFLTGDEITLKPMILKDIAEITGLDISTISRVANSKFVQTEFGTKRLKDFFSESVKKKDGEEVSTLEVKKILTDVIANESKQKPLSDEKLKETLGKHGYSIARRTIAKYREQLNIPVARLRKEL